MKLQGEGHDRTTFAAKGYERRLGKIQEKGKQLFDGQGIELETPNVKGKETSN